MALTGAVLFVSPAEQHINARMCSSMLVLVLVRRHILKQARIKSVQDHHSVERIPGQRGKMKFNLVALLVAVLSTNVLAGPILQNNGQDIVSVDAVEDVMSQPGQD